MAAAVTATAVVAATVPGQGTAAPLQARTAAYVVSRVTAALAANNKVLQTTTTFGASFPTVRGRAYGGGFRAIQSGYIAPAQMPGNPWAQGRTG